VRAARPKMTDTVVWTKDNCFYCVMAKELLTDLNLKFEERNISQGSWTKEQLLEAAPDSKPLAIMASGQGLGLGPFAFTISPDSKIKLNKSAILFVHKTDAEMANQYTQSTTGIQI